MKKLTESGQALLEYLVVTPVGILIVALLFYSAAAIWSVSWVQYQLQESVLCLSDENPWKCREQGLRKIQSGARYLEITSLRLEKKRDRLYGSLEFQFSIQRSFQFKMEKVLPWPLRI